MWLLQRKQAFCFVGKGAIMKKGHIAILSAAAILAGAMLIPPVQAATISALSVFRVSDTKTITISMTDIQALSAKIKQPGENKTKSAAQSDAISQQLDAYAKSEVQPLGSTKEFHAFSIYLPEGEALGTPKLYSISSQTKTVTLDTQKLNAELAKAGASPLSETYNGTKISIVTPPAAIAAYADATLLETQGAYIDAPAKEVDALWSSLTSATAIPADLRSQLAAIDPTSRDVYLPVIEGLGRQTDIGVTTGYLYSAKDLAQLSSAIPNFPAAETLSKLQSDNTTVLIWTKNGILYALAGKKSDSALTQIARSIHS